MRRARARTPRRLRRGETPQSPFFWFFFCGYLLKKRTKSVFSHKISTVVAGGYGIRPYGIEIRGGSKTEPYGGVAGGYGIRPYGIEIRGGSKTEPYGVIAVDS